MRAGRGKGHLQPIKDKSKRAKKNCHRADLNAPAKSTHTGGSQSFSESARSSEDLHEVNEVLIQQVVTNYNKDDHLLEVVGGHNKEKHIPGLESLARTESHDRTSYSSDGRTPGAFDYLNARNRIDDYFEQKNRHLSNMERNRQIMSGRLSNMERNLSNMERNLQIMSGRMSNMERNQQIMSDQQIMIMDEVKRLHAEMGPGGPGPDYSGAS